MASDFSILPLPKYDESQPAYCSYTSNVIFTMLPAYIENAIMKTTE